jgi:hypothetical protein
MGTGVSWKFAKTSCSSADSSTTWETIVQNGGVSGTCAVAAGGVGTHCSGGDEAACTASQISGGGEFPSTCTGGESCSGDTLETCEGVGEGSTGCSFTAAGGDHHENCVFTSASDNANCASFGNGDHRGVEICDIGFTGGTGNNWVANSCIKIERNSAYHGYAQATIKFLDTGLQSSADHTGIVPHEQPYTGSSPVTLREVYQFQLDNMGYTHRDVSGASATAIDASTGIVTIPIAVNIRIGAATDQFGDCSVGVDACTVSSGTNEECASKTDYTSCNAASTPDGTCLFVPSTTSLTGTPQTLSIVHPGSMVDAFASFTDFHRTSAGATLGELNVPSGVSTSSAPASDGSTGCKLTFSGEVTRQFPIKKMHGAYYKTDLTSCDSITCKKALQFGFGTETWYSHGINFNADTVPVPGSSVPSLTQCTGAETCSGATKAACEGEEGSPTGCTFAALDAQEQWDAGTWGANIKLVKNGGPGLFYIADGANNNRANLLHEEVFTTIGNTVPSECTGAEGLSCTGATQAACETVSGCTFTPAKCPPVTKALYLMADQDEIDTFHSSNEKLCEVAYPDSDTNYNADPKLTFTYSGVQTSEYEPNIEDAAEESNDWKIGTIAPTSDATKIKFTYTPTTYITEERLVEQDDCTGKSGVSASYLDGNSSPQSVALKTTLPDDGLCEFSSGVLELLDLADIATATCTGPESASCAGGNQLDCEGAPGQENGCTFTAGSSVAGSAWVDPAVIASTQSQDTKNGHDTANQYADRRCFAVNIAGSSTVSVKELSGYLASKSSSERSEADQIIATDFNSPPSAPDSATSTLDKTLANALIHDKSSTAASTNQAPTHSLAVTYMGESPSLSFAVTPVKLAYTCGGAGSTQALTYTRDVDFPCSTVSGLTHTRNVPVKYSDAQVAIAIDAQDVTHVQETDHYNAAKDSGAGTTVATFDVTNVAIVDQASNGDGKLECEFKSGDSGFKCDVGNYNSGSTSIGITVRYTQPENNIQDMSCVVTTDGTNPDCALARRSATQTTEQACTAATASGGGGVAANACVFTDKSIVKNVVMKLK